MKKKLNNYQEIEKLNFEIMELKIKILKHDIIYLEKKKPFWFQTKKSQVFKEKINKLKLEIMEISLKEKELLEKFQEKSNLL